MNYISRIRFLALFLTVTLLFTLALSYAKSVGSDISDAVVRLHIVANSNTDTDQWLKLKVRDRIVSESAYLFENISDSEQALSIARTNTEVFRKLALDEIHRQGFDMPVTVSVGKCAFPTKYYDGITLPAGQYNAVNIQLGESKGENWWCVMYPPLCFTDGIVSLSDKAKTKLQKSLTAEEYKLITESSGSVPVQIKFKFIEVLQTLF